MEAIPPVVEFLQFHAFLGLFCSSMLKEPPDLVTISEKCEELRLLTLLASKVWIRFPEFLSQFCH